MNERKKEIYVEIEKEEKQERNMDIEI